MKKKRRGSSLIIVIIIMAILFTTGSAVLTLTASDYKMRTNASKKLENLYAADSGLDIVENVILKNSEAAIICANQKIKAKYDGQEMTKELYEKINEKFKAEFINFLGIEAVGKGANITDAVLAQGIANRKYKILKKDGTFDWKIDIDKKSEIEITRYAYDAPKNIIQIEVESTFETINTGIKNKKILATKYTITAPDYKEPISSDNVLIDIYPVFDGKIITADGNLTLTGTAEVKGDIWVKGNDDIGNDPSYVFDKYNRGILIEKGNLTLEGNIITNRTLHLKNLANATITGDVYALNAYVGKSDKTGISSGNNLNIDGNLIVNNDLSLNAKKSRIVVENNFYGINDKTEPNADTADKALKSSSIIVNEIDKGSSLTVNEDSYIMGVAYIDAADEQGNRYQTGESVAVKGNYLAYSDVLSGYADKVTLKYYNPLQLIDTINGVDSIEAKAEYISAYFKDTSTLKNGGVDLKGSVHSVGAYIKDAKLQYSGWNADSQITDKRNEFAKNVFAMGDTNGIDTKAIYNDGKVLKTVESQIDFKGIYSEKAINETYGKLILNNNKKTIVIKGDTDDADGYKDNDKYMVIDASKDLKAVIITNGDVLVTGEVGFTGNIIAQGNIRFEDDKNKNLTYDANVTRKIIASNYAAVKDALKGASTTSQQASVNIGDKINIDIKADGYNLKGLLKTGNWKIVK
ncbi:hypothetical protein KPL39_16780 [Clostridium gasigenes]|uniref:hypothetical protein n=1 Tax=Clostridium gasigenes TaxID=94869 RepID=UPI001C0BE879|nr:hypothetical protein [Clostridium gasigenes]MBU3137899.1 hypothetical protein [Clostridium gasigenes]